MEYVTACTPKCYEVLPNSQMHSCDCVRTRAFGRTYEYDGRREGAGLGEEVADACGGDAGEHLHELGALFVRITYYFMY